MSGSRKAKLLGKLLWANLSLFFFLLLLNNAFGVKISDTVLFVCLATMTSFIAAVWAFGYWQFTRTHTPEQRAALAAQSELQRERAKVADEATRYKRKVLRTGVKGRAVVIAADNLRLWNEYRGTLFDLQLAVTVGADTPYVVRTGEYIEEYAVNAVKIGRELRVRVDPNDPKRVAVDWQWIMERVAVDWKKAEQLRQSPAWRQEQIAKRLKALETLCAKGAISDVEYATMRDQVITDE